jgi:hypothetical protein
LAAAVPAAGPPWLHLDQLASRAEAMVGGCVTRQRVEWDGRGRLFTVYSLNGNEFVFGRPEQQLEIWQAGGEDPAKGVGMLVPGVPHFRSGEWVLLLLHRSSPGRFHVSGAAFGARRFASEAACRRAVARLKTLSRRWQWSRPE